MTEYTLFFCPGTRAFHGLWMMEEAGVAYDLQVIDIRDAARGEAYRSVNPMGKVPALSANGELITESPAICAYVADAEPQAGLAPKIGELGRGSYLRWLFFCAAAIEPAFIDKAFGRETPHATSGWGNVESVLLTLRAGLKDKAYLVGGRFSAADLMVGSTINFLMNFKLMDPEPVFTDYVARLTARPAFQRATEMDASLRIDLYGESA